MAARDARMLNALAHALGQAAATGSAVAGDDARRRAEMAHVSLRHIRGFDRRKIPLQDHQRAAKDLAKGLVAAFEKDSGLAVPLIGDYERLAARLLKAYAAVPPDPAPEPPSALPAAPSEDQTT